VSDFFERLRSAESPEAVRSLYAQALATSATSTPREVAALRHGVRERLGQLGRVAAAPKPEPKAGAVRYGKRLSRVPVLSRAKSRATKAGGGILSAILMVVAARALFRLATDGPSPREKRHELIGIGGSDTKFTFHESLATVPKWKETVPRIDALLREPSPDRAEAKAILEVLGLTENDVMILIIRKRAEPADLARLKGLQRVLRPGPPVPK
jgi:hypothetical protein